MSSRRRLRIIVIAAFAILSGMGEIIVGVTGNYLGILKERITPSIATAIVGMFYLLAGLSLLMRTKRGAALAMLTSDERCVVGGLVGFATR